MTGHMTRPDPLPLLDEAAVEAMAKRAYEEATRSPWAEIPEAAKPSWCNVARRDLAAYFAALDPAELVERACAAQWGEGYWPNVPNAAGERVYMRKALEALGLFTPDTEEPDGSPD